MLNSGYLSPGNYICVSKDVRIRGYFSKPQGICEQESLGSTGLDGSGVQKIPCPAGIRNPDRPAP